MAVAKYIKDLVNLALEDRVLTYRERQTIVATALKYGVSEKDINIYLDKALRRRLKEYDKEQIQHCPSCGAQVPLFAEDCLFCGKPLTSGKRKVIPLPVVGEAADIIREENRKTEIKEREIKQCPDCGAPFPLISHICNYCGHILHEQTGYALNAQNLIINIQAQRSKLQGIEKPTVGEVLIYRLDAVLLALSVMLYLIAPYFGKDEPIVFTFAGFALIMFMVTGLRDKKSAVAQADDAFYEAVNNYRMDIHQVATFYGDNSEAKEVLGQYAAEIDTFKKSRLKNRNFLAGAIGLIIAIPLVPYVLSTIFSINISSLSGESTYKDDRKENPVVYEMSEFNKILHPYPDSTVKAPLADYVSVTDDACLSFDVSCGSHIAGDGKNIHYRLRLEPVNIVSKGKKYEVADEDVWLYATLLDKDGNVVGGDMGRLSIWNHSQIDKAQVLLQKGKGHYYGDFTAKYYTKSVQRLRQIADSAYYFVIY